MANTAQLRKGHPPKRQVTPDVMAIDPRRNETPKKPLQFMVPQDVFNAFSALAGAEFGFSKGAKLKLFLAMWKAYQSKSSKCL
ncbi:MAG: hypothetical protein OXC62_06260 [Aestuariivita sp.]|nr:hypothetical protein [Aestuariivita sp.]